MSTSGTKVISRAVWLLSLVSLFTDMASEMLYPIMPAYLKSIGFSVLLIGILEGVAEAVAGLSKGYFGQLSDSYGRRMPFVRTGYFFSAISKPMLALSAVPLWVFFSRTMDRLGKGIRTAARDALLNSESTAKTKGTVFGLHRSLDTVGAILGPVIALAVLAIAPENYVLVFLIAFIPGLLAIAITLVIREKKTESVARSKVLFSDFLKYLPRATVDYKKAITVLLLFTLFNSSDLFLLIRVKESGASDSQVLGLYIFYNIVFALFAYPLGKLADRFGLHKLIIAGFLLFALTYSGMAFAQDLYAHCFLLFLYGLYAAATEGVSKAWIGKTCNESESATAYGTFHAFQSIAIMLASFITGSLWFSFGAKTALITCAAGAVISVLLILVLSYRSKGNNFAV